jgi:serine/threonine-protein kinase
VKLENIMRGADGRIVIVDFGSARPLHHSSLPVYGTPSYAAPELFIGASPNVASDIFALGVLLFRLITGAFPYSAPNSRELVELHFRGEQCDVFALAPTLPHASAEVLQRALQIQPDRRFSNMAEFERALDANIDHK